MTHQMQSLPSITKSIMKASPCQLNTVDNNWKQTPSINSTFIPAYDTSKHDIMKIFLR